MEYHDKVLKCGECGAEFVFTAGEQMFFADKGFKNEPKRCKACKANRAQGTDQVGRASSALKRKRSARNAGKRPRFLSSRHRAGRCIAGSASSSGVR